MLLCCLFLCNNKRRRRRRAVAPCMQSGHFSSWRRLVLGFVSTFTPAVSQRGRVHVHPRLGCSTARRFGSDRIGSIEPVQTSNTPIRGS